MPKNIQNLVVVLEPTQEAYDKSLNAGNMCLNRFSIDEDSAFELSGVHHFEKSSLDINLLNEYVVERKTKGKGYLSLQLIVSVCLIC